MAESKIEKPTGSAVKNTFYCYVVGTTGTKDSGYCAVNQKLRIAEVSLNALGTGASLSAGQSYDVGSLEPFGIYPLSTIRCDANRTDGGNAPATLEISTNGSIKLKPLASIPSGVNLRAHCMFFYQ